MKQLRQTAARLAAAMLLLACMPGAARGAESPALYSRTVHIDELGDFIYYAQNDPLWGDSVYEPPESDTRRTMQAGGCGPTAAAIVIANALTADRLPEIRGSARRQDRGFRFCPCSVSAYYCRDRHEKTCPVTPEEYQQWLPAVFASIATGNNKNYFILRREGLPTSLALFEVLAEYYGMDYEALDRWEEIQPELEQGHVVITTVLDGIFTETSHFLCVAGVTDEWVYLLDPYARDSYPRDHANVLEVLEPGVIRARQEALQRLHLACYYVIKEPVAGKSAGS